MCDVVHIDACHMLFGHSWQFDLNTVHNGKNTPTLFHYIFIMEYMVTMKAPPDTKEGSYTNWCNSLLEFALTCALTERKRYYKFKMRICIEENSNLIEDWLIFTMDLAHIYSTHI